MVDMMVPPAAVPEVVDREVMVGAARYVNPLVKVAVCVPTFTTTETEPAAWAGVVAVQVVLLLQETLVAAVPPKVKLVLPLMSKLVPVRVVMIVPPAMEPVALEMPVRVGTPRKVNEVAPVTVCRSTVTSTLTNPAAWAGVVAVQVVVLLQVTPVAAVPPNLKLVSP